MDSFFPHVMSFFQIVLFCNLQTLADILPKTAEKDGKVNFVAVAQILQVPAQVR